MPGKDQRYLAASADPADEAQQESIGHETGRSDQDDRLEQRQVRQILHSIYARAFFNFDSVLNFDTVHRTAFCNTT